MSTEAELLDEMTRTAKALLKELRSFGSPLSAKCQKLGKDLEALIKISDKRQPEKQLALEVS